jgi:hypothetical protein
MLDFVAEDHCALCSHMWRSEREAFRANLDALQGTGPPWLLARFGVVG